MKDMLQKERFSPGMQLALLLVFCGLGIVLSSVLTALAIKMFGLSVGSLPDIVTDRKYIGIARLLQSVGAVLIMAVPALMLAYVSGPGPSKIGFNRMVSGKQVFFVVLMVIPAMILSGALAELTNLIPLPKDTAAYFKQLDDSYNQTVLAMAYMPTVQDYLISLVVIALIPAVAEEMLFRGALQTTFARMFRHPLPPILITALIFSLIHFSYFGFLSRLFLGVLLGMVYHNSRNIWLSIILHFLNNAFIVTQLYALTRAGIPMEKALDETAPVWYGLLAIPIIWMLMAVFLKESREVQAYHILEAEFHKKEEEDHGV